MTKKEAERIFREEIMPGILKSEAEGTGKVDFSRRREAWNNFTDSLCKSGRITLKQYETWEGPE